MGVDLQTHFGTRLDRDSCRSSFLHSGVARGRPGFSSRVGHAVWRLPLCRPRLDARVLGRLEDRRAGPRDLRERGKGHGPIARMRRPAP